MVQSYSMSWAMSPGMTNIPYWMLQSYTMSPLMTNILYWMTQSYAMSHVTGDAKYSVLNAAALYPVKSNVTDDAKYSIFYAQSYTIGNFMMPNILYRKVQPYHVIIHVTGVSKYWMVQSSTISQRHKDAHIVHIWLQTNIMTHFRKVKGSKVG